MKTTNKNRNAACKPGLFGASDGARNALVRTRIGYRPEKHTMSKPGNPGISHPQRSSNNNADKIRATPNAIADGVPS
jgi:hypothetical protein